MKSFQNIYILLLSPSVKWALHKANKKIERERSLSTQRFLYLAVSPREQAEINMQITNGGDGIEWNLGSPGRECHVTDLTYGD